MLQIPDKYFAQLFSVFYFLALRLWQRLLKDGHCFLIVVLFQVGDSAEDLTESLRTLLHKFWRSFVEVFRVDHIHIVQQMDQQMTGVIFYLEFVKQR